MKNLSDNFRMLIAEFGFRARTITERLGLKKSVGWFLLCALLAFGWIGVVFSYFPTHWAFKILQMIFTTLAYFILITHHLYDYVKKKRRKSPQNINNHDS